MNEEREAFIRGSKDITLSTTMLVDEKQVEDLYRAFFTATPTGPFTHHFQLGYQPAYSGWQRPMSWLLSKLLGIGMPLRPEVIISPPPMYIHSVVESEGGLTINASTKRPDPVEKGPDNA